MEKKIAASPSGETTDEFTLANGLIYQLGITEFIF
jgi:hypothetical protein